MKRVYIAGPYTKGDTAIHVRNAILAADAVSSMGATPFVPHLTHFWHLISPKDYEFWTALDNEWLVCCDILLRLPGESSGSDAEEALARKLGIPVVYSLEELSEALKVSSDASRDDELAELRAQNATYRKGLEDIIKHQEMIAGTMNVHSSVLLIARKALA